MLLREEKDRELVFGAVVCCDVRVPPRSAEEFQALQGSLARAVMNFHVEDAGGGVSRLVTETRVAASDARSERVFARYWRVIYPGSALIRVMWLRAIKARAEARHLARSGLEAHPRRVRLGPDRELHGQEAVGLGHRRLGAVEHVVHELRP